MRRGSKGDCYEGGLRIPFLARWPGKIEAGSVSEHLGYFPDIMPTLAELAGVESPKSSDGISIVPALLGAYGEQRQHAYLYWEDKRGKVGVRERNWKAVKPGNKEDFELYNLEEDIQELNDLAEDHPQILDRLKKYADEAHTPRVEGKVLDESLGFKGHEAD